MKTEIAKKLKLFFGVFFLVFGLLICFAAADPTDESESGSQEEQHVHDFEWSPFASASDAEFYLLDPDYHYHRCRICKEFFPDEKEAHTITFVRNPEDPSIGCRAHCDLCGYEETGWRAHDPDREAPDTEHPVLCKNCGYEIEPRVSIFMIEIYHGSEDTDGYKWVEFTDPEGAEKNGKKRMSVAEGSVVDLTVLDPEKPSIYVVTELIFLDASSGTEEVLQTITVTEVGTFSYTMPSTSVRIRVVMEEDSAKAEESSIEESRSIEESIAEESRIRESERAAKRFNYGHYLVEPFIEDVEHPGDFIPGFSDSLGTYTGCFYSLTYRINVYYASFDGETYDFYVQDPISRDLFPFVTFRGTGDKSYVVSAPVSLADIEGRYIREEMVSLPLASSGPVDVPAFVSEIEDETLKLIYLMDNDGHRAFHVFNNDHGTVELPELSKYLENKRTGRKDDSDIVMSTEETKKAEPAPQKGLTRPVIWLIIVGVIVILITAAVVTVLVMSRQQEARERELDEEEEDEPLDEIDDMLPEEAALEGEIDDEIPEDDFGTSTYQNAAPSDAEEEVASDYNFENAFPEEADETSKQIDFEDIED